MVYNDNVDGVVYLRDKLEFEINKDAPQICHEINRRFKNFLFEDNHWPLKNEFPYWEFLGKRNVYYYGSLRNKKGETFEQFKFVIIFCGKIYPLVKFVKTYPYTNIVEHTYFYSESLFNEYLSNNGLVLKTKKDENLVTRFFANSGSDADKEFLMVNKITNVILINDNRNKLVFNARLADYEFYKVLDTYTCFQELNMWLTGTLSYPQNLMIEVQDKSKIIKHGFDTKYGFRTRPGKKSEKNS